ncbi:peptidase family M48-domain-containing protein [Rhizoctonia solani]|nr:peptidase family M48-domain-containing protein [Rhizoctonia solani]
MLRRAVGIFSRPPSRLPATSFQSTLNPAAAHLDSISAISYRNASSARPGPSISTLCSTPPLKPFHVFFFALPALKGYLLELTRFTLVLLPFIWRYRIWKKYPRWSLALLQIPVFAVCIIVALGLDQCPRTERWRLLMMSKREEMEWARARFTECLLDDGPHLLREDDPRVEQVRRVAERLFTVVEDGGFDADHVVSSPGWPPRSEEPQLAQLQGPAGPWSTGRRVHVTPASFGKMQAQLLYPPSATAESRLMPFRPETSNPTKVIDDQSWRLYVVDLPKVNAFALPTREIFVYTGLIDLLEDDTLLSGVMSHEIAHVTQRHAVENFLNIAAIFFDTLRGISFALTVSFPFLTDGIGTILNLMNNYVADRAYSRKLESEADAVGLEFMARAGYDPRYALDLWEVMAAVEEDAAAAGQAVSVSETFPFLRTHPSSLQRRKDLEKLMPKAMELFARSPLRSRPEQRRVENKIEERKEEPSAMSQEYEHETTTA